MNKKYLPILKKRNPKSLKNCLDDFKKSWEDLNKLSEINENWRQLIGLELFKECKPLKFEQKTVGYGINKYILSFSFLASYLLILMNELFTTNL